MSDTNNKVRLLETLKTVFESCAILIGLSYAIGLIVVNTYLLTLGTVEFELIRAKYISCGFLVLIIMLILASVSLPRIMIDKSKPAVYLDHLTFALKNVVWTSCFILFGILFVSEKGFPFLVGSIPTSIFVILFLLGVVIPLITPFFEEKAFVKKFSRIENIISSLSTILFFFLTAQSKLKYFILWEMGFFFVLSAIFAPDDNAGDPEIEVSNPRSLVFVYNWGKLAYGLGAGMILLITFGRYIYPEINPAIGGGMPRSALIVPFNDKSQELDNLLASRNVKIIDQTQNFFYLIPQKENLKHELVQINKQLISGIIYRDFTISDDSSKNITKK